MVAVVAQGDEQQQRLESLQSDPETAWRVSDRDWEHWKMYDLFEKAADRILHKTSTGEAPWNIVEGEDHYYRSITVGTSRSGYSRTSVMGKALAELGVGIEDLPLALHAALSAVDDMLAAIPWMVMTPRYTPSSTTKM